MHDSLRWWNRNEAQLYIAWVVALSVSVAFPVVAYWGSPVTNVLAFVTCQEVTPADVQGCSP